MTIIDQVWLPPPTNLILSSDEVHVWRAWLNLPASQIHRLRRTLATDELERAGRFYFEKDRQHFIAGRGLLRLILGRYLKTAPGQLRFRYSDYGKPALVLNPGQAPLQARLNFNVSHSYGLALYAVTLGREVGLDLEKIRSDLEYEEIAERFFSSQESAVLRKLPAEVKPQAFFNCWTRKEAYIKARGEGLSLPLDQFDVSLVPGEPARLLDVREDSQEASRWSLYALTPASGYVAALAVEGSDWRLKCWQGGISGLVGN
jgi:4'-phosphopantetheinyl transferase